MVRLLGTSITLIALTAGAVLIRRLTRNIEIAAARVQSMKKDPNLKSRNSARARR